MQGFILLTVYFKHTQSVLFSFDIVLYHKHEEIGREVSKDITNTFINCSPSVYSPFLNMSLFLVFLKLLCICVYEHMHAGVVSC